jgi:hypothetical protein
MNLAAIVVGVLAALLAPVMVVVAMAMGALLNLVQLGHARVRTVRKLSNSPGVRKGDAEVVRVREGQGGSVDEFRPAA